MLPIKHGRQSWTWATRAFRLKRVLAKIVRDTLPNFIATLSQLYRNIIAKLSQHYRNIIHLLLDLNRRYSLSRSWTSFPQSLPTRAAVPA